MIFIVTYGIHTNNIHTVSAVSHNYTTLRVKQFEIDQELC